MAGTKTVLIVFAQSRRGIKVERGQVLLLFYIIVDEKQGDMCLGAGKGREKM